MESGSHKSGLVSERTASADAGEVPSAEGPSDSGARAPAVALDSASMDLIHEPGNEDLLSFYQHWEGLRTHPDEIPLKDRFDPIEIPRLLGKVLLAEVTYEPSLRVRFRILGSHIVEIEGTNHTGKFLDEINPDPDTVMRRHYVDLIEQGRMYVRQDTAYWSGREHMAYSILLLPLASEDGQISHILGIVDWQV